MLDYHISNLNMRAVAFVDDLEWVKLNVRLNRWFIKSPTNQPFDIKDCVFGVCCQLVLGCIANQPLAFRSERNIRRRDTVALVIGDDLDATILENSNATSIKTVSSISESIKPYQSTVKLQRQSRAK